MKTNSLMDGYWSWVDVYCAKTGKRKLQHVRLIDYLIQTKDVLTEYHPLNEHIRKDLRNWGVCLYAKEYIVHAGIKPPPPLEDL